MPSIAVLCDIHSNTPALQAVMADLKDLRPDAVFVLGDMINGCPWPAEVLDLIAAQRWPMLLGNHDDAVIQLGTPRMEPRYANRDLYAPLWWTRERLRTDQYEVLQGLPLAIVPDLAGLPPIRLLHGLPGNFFVGIRPDSPDAWVSDRLATVAEPTIASGHSHVPIVRRISRWLVVNAGSVGMPYDGDCRASYAWLRGDDEGWQVGIRRVPYNLDELNAGFMSSGLLAEGGAMAEMARRSALSGQPWIADFAWWVREQTPAILTDMSAALKLYDATHGPGRWAFPYV